MPAGVQHIWPRGPASPQRRTRRPLLQISSPGTPTTILNKRRRVANAGGTTSVKCVSPSVCRHAERYRFLRECWQEYIGTPGVRILNRETGMASSCRSLSRFFCDALLRMKVELQTINLGVAGSNPAGSVSRGRSSVVEHDTFHQILVAARHHSFSGECRWNYR